ncbi:trypsin-like peptidase domain-containing protein [Ideonella sp.]|uniref:trypsin-like peptidase domain-containing protein n=1 Tax=Ideonella sp. TaxID=1929293 RepID=UPI00351BAC8D
MAFAEPDPATLIKLSTSVLKVEVMRTQGGYSLGSGVVIGEDRVVTNCHVTRDARLISVLQGGLRLPAQSQQVDAYHDLCVLHVRGIEGSRAVAFGPAGRLTIGQVVTAVGHTAGAFQGSSGEVLALHRMDGAQVIQASNFFSSGASGGGLFDADLHLVGILTFRLRGGNAHYFAAPIEWLARSRMDSEAAQQIGPLAPGELAFWERLANAQPTFLRAAALEVEGNWRGLQPLAAEWTLLDAGDPEPWYLLGLALSRLDQPRDARLALECSLAISPDYAAARNELQRLALPRDAQSETHVAGISCRH